MPKSLKNRLRRPTGSKKDLNQLWHVKNAARRAAIFFGPIILTILKTKKNTVAGINQKRDNLENAAALFCLQTEVLATNSVRNDSYGF